MTEHFDLVILGSGSGAFAVAIAAVRKGKRVAMVEQATVGGTCVNVGCIPSKALLAAAEAAHTAAGHPFPGVASAAQRVDMGALVAGKDELVEALQREKYLELIDHYGWELVAGHAEFVAGPSVQVEGRRLQAERYVVATGASPWAPAIDGLHDTGFLTSTTSMELAEVPESLIVIGGNYVGLEQAQFFSRIGTEVTVLEMAERIAPAEEPEISQALAGVLADEGIAVHAGVNVTRITRDGQGVLAAAEVDGAVKDFRAQHVLMATGRRPNTAGLGLQEVGIEVGTRGEIVVDAGLRTSNEAVYAVGDVTGHPQFVYVAGAHGAIAVDNAFEEADRRVDYTTMPRVTFTQPQVAAVGLSEAEAKAQGVECTCQTLDLAWVPRAIVNRDTRGLVKIVAETATGRIRGVHILADDAGDVILAAVYALEAGWTVDKVANLWAPYLTMAESLKLAAQAFRGDVSRLSCCAA